MRLNLVRASFVLAHALFLWMYFAAEPLEMLARHGGFAETGPSVVQTADRYAAAWRHGMAGNAWLYLPGFFLAAAFTWMWALGRRLRTLGIEGTVLLSLAVLAAAPLAPLGTELALAAFQDATGLRAVVPAPAFTFRGAILALFTIVTWDVGVLCCQQTIVRRSFRPMWIAVVLNVVLANVRPWTVADFTTQWAGDIAQGRVVAILSACAVPLLSALLVLYQLLPRDSTAAPRASPSLRIPRLTAWKRAGRTAIMQAPEAGGGEPCGLIQTPSGSRSQRPRPSCGEKDS